MITWKIKHIFNFKEDKLWENGFSFFGFHDKYGNHYVLMREQHWLGHLLSNDTFAWTAGAVNKNLCNNHIYFDLKNPHFITDSPDSHLLVTSHGNKSIYKIIPEKCSVELFIDTQKYGFKDVGNCVLDKNNNIWINEITGCKIWKFDSNGNPINTLGNGEAGFQQSPISIKKVRFNWIYDLRIGPDGNVYVLDSKNFAVRMIDIDNEIVHTLVGTGEPGYTGDGGDAKYAKLGGGSVDSFDGPYSLSLDEDGNIFIGDTYNHVVRMVEKSSNTISTIVGKNKIIKNKRNDPKEKDPLMLNLPVICSMNYYNKYLFVPEWDGDLIVLEKSN